MVPWGAFFSVLRTPFNRHFYIWTQGTLSVRFFTLQNFVSAFKSKLFVESLIQGNITCQVNRLYFEYEAKVFRVWYLVTLTACLRPETHGGWRRRIAPPTSAIPTSNSDCNSLRILKNSRQQAKITTYFATLFSSSVKPPSSKLVETIAGETNSSSNIENVSESYQFSLLMSSRHNWRTFAFVSWKNMCVRNNTFRGSEKCKILRRLGQPAE